LPIAVWLAGYAEDDGYAGFREEFEEVPLVSAFRRERANSERWGGSKQTRKAPGRPARWRVGSGRYRRLLLGGTADQACEDEAVPDGAPATKPVGRGERWRTG
jgi:hypothetical protein